MTMRRFALDFHRSDTRGGLLRFAILALGVVAALACAARFEALRKETTLWEAKLEDLTQLAKRKSLPLGVTTRDGKLPVEEIKRANLVLEHMAVPWGILFSELEATAGDGLALLAIQPDVPSRQVRIAGVASSFPAVTQFVTRLEAQPHLDAVHLVEHEIRPNAPGKPVAFSILATWVDRK
jgi:Tfp pilus assembly protein PilN